MSSQISVEHMKFKITIYAIGRYPVLEISQDEFYKLKSAKKCLSSALAIEEKYELLLSNYMELEKDVLGITVDNMLRRNESYSDFFDIRLKCNRRLINLLTATRLYIDQVHRHLRDCMSGEEDAESYTKQLFSEQYDTHFEYRFMEALRNYSQHRGLAVHTTSLGSSRMQMEDSSYFEFNSSIFSLKSELELDDTFKKSVLNEMTEKVDLIQCARRYVESINIVQCLIRDKISPVSADARSLIESYLAKYREIHKEPFVGLYALSYTDEEHGEKIEDKVVLLLDWDESRIALSKMNGTLVNLHKRYVSSATHNKQNNKAR